MNESVKGPHLRLEGENGLEVSSDETESKEVHSLGGTSHRSTDSESVQGRRKTVHLMLKTGTSNHGHQNGCISNSHDRCDPRANVRMSSYKTDNSKRYPIADKITRTSNSHNAKVAAKSKDVNMRYSNDAISEVISQDKSQSTVGSREAHEMSSQSSVNGHDKKKCPELEGKSKKVGQYLLGRTIGEGSFGKVRMATHLISKQQVAIKVVTKKMLVLHESARRHFRREALFLRHVCHPNVIKLYEAMETSNSYYLAFQLATGGTLLEYVAERGNLTEDESRLYMRQIVSAVDHLHKSGIVHRDLKLENFLLDGEKNIKLVDFSLSTICHGTDHHLSTQCGSPVYAAPELFAGRKYGKPVDVWSLGVCLFAMLVGRLPFLPTDQTSLIQLYSLILRGCTPPEHLSASCRALLWRMLELEEMQRITVEEMLSHHWLLDSAGQPIKRYAAIPKKVPENTINYSVVKYMCTMFRFSESDVLTSIFERKLTASAATYNILKDSIEAGQMTLSLPREWSNVERAASNMKSSSRQSSRSTTRTTNLRSSSHFDDKSVPKTSSMDKKKLSDNSNKMNNETSQSEDSPSLNSYKAPLRTLKQMRQRGSHTVVNADQPEMYDCVVVGHSPHENKMHNVGNDLAVPSTSAGSNGSRQVTFPPISPTTSWGSDHTTKRSFAPGNKSQGHFFHRNQVLDFKIKGMPPSIKERSGALNMEAISMYRQMHHPIPIRTHFSPFFLGQRTPPPPPPNSSYGTHSNQSPSPSHKDHRVNISANANHGTKTPSISDNPDQPEMPDIGQDWEDIHRHRREHRRGSKDPLRPCLAALRDPFSRDTWSKPRAERQKRLMKQSSNREDGVRRDHASNHRDASRIPSLVPFIERADTHSQLREREGGLAPLDGESLHVDFHDNDDAESPPPLGFQRNDTDSPISQSQDKEDYMTPVTRVTITTIGRH